MCTVYVSYLGIWTNSWWLFFFYRQCMEKKKDWSRGAHIRNSNQITRSSCYLELSGSSLALRFVCSQPNTDSIIESNRYDMRYQSIGTLTCDNLGEALLFSQQGSKILICQEFLRSFLDHEIFSYCAKAILLEDVYSWWNDRLCAKIYKINILFIVFFGAKGRQTFKCLYQHVTQTFRYVLSVKAFWAVLNFYWTFFINWINKTEQFTDEYCDILFLSF